jgi:hypothetical protein
MTDLIRLLRMKLHAKLLLWAFKILPDEEPEMQEFADVVGPYFQKHWKWWDRKPVYLTPCCHWNDRKKKAS